jgi:Phage tail tube protein
MTIAAGINKTVVVKKESSWGVAPGATGAQVMRRVESNLDLQKATYQSNEIRPDGQTADFRHGVQSVAGNIKGELSVGTYNDFFAAALRKDFPTAATTGAIIVLAVTGTGTEYTRSSGDFISDGFKLGDVVEATGFTETNNTSHRGLVTSLTTTVMTIVTLDGVVLTDEAEGDSVTIVVVGKKTFAATTSHTDDSFAIEHWFSDISQDELFLGLKPQSIAVGLPPSGMATVDVAFMGKSVTTDTSAYYTTPTAAGSDSVLSAVNGLVYVGGVAVALITGMDFTITTGLSAEPVVGSNVHPAIFRGRVLVEGNMTVYFEDATFRDYFINETEVSIYCVFKGDSTKNTPFTSFVMPRVKVGGSGKDDGEKGLVQSVPFTALLNTAGGASVNTEETTISIQDSAAT